MLAGVRKRSALLCHRLQPPDAGQRGLATATFAKPALLSKIYAPTSKLDRSQGTETLRSVDYLVKAGFIRQVRTVRPSSRPRCRRCALAESDTCSRDASGKSSAGIYSLLPFGQRVLEKLEKIIEHEMYSLGALA